MTTLTTQRLSLRAPQKHDAALFKTLLTNAQTRRYLGGPVPAERLEVEVRRLLAPSKDQTLWVAYSQTAPLGLIYLSPHHDPAHQELSYTFLPSATGQGYATEACKAVCTHAFLTLNLSQLVAETQATNAASCALLTRLGFTATDRFERFGAQQILYRLTAPA